MIKKFIQDIRDKLNEFDQEEKVAGVFVFILFALIFGVFLMNEGARKTAKMIDMTETHYTYPVNMGVQNV